MNETKHTPGPWGLHAGDPCLVIAIKPYREISSMETDQPIASKEDRANARLIAAAPELLAALKEIIADHEQRMRLYSQQECQENRVRVMELAEVAISKAEGKP